MKKVSLIMILVMLSGGVYNVPVYSESSNRFEKEAYNLYKLGVFAGKSTTEYMPALEDLLTREESMKLIAILFAWAVDMNEETHFDDVSSWASPYVKVGFDRGVTAGVGSGLFGGKDNVTYAQFYTWIIREFGKEDPYSSDKLTWKKNIIFYAKQLNIYFEDIDDLFGNINRDFAVGIMHRLLPSKVQDSEASVYMNIVNKYGSTGDVELEETYYNKTSFSIIPTNGFPRNGMIQVIESEAKTYTVTLTNVSQTLSHITLELCSRGLCSLIEPTILSSSGNTYEISINNELIPGEEYYFSNVFLRYSDTSSDRIQLENNIISPKFMVMNNLIDKDNPVTFVQDRDELDRLVNYPDANVMVNITGLDWCYYCVLLEPIYKGAAEILEGDVMFLCVNIPTNMDLEGFEYNGVPWQFFYQNGSKLSYIRGYRELTSEQYAEIVTLQFDNPELSIESIFNMID